MSKVSLKLLVLISIIGFYMILSANLLKVLAVDSASQQTCQNNSTISSCKSGESLFDCQSGGNTQCATSCNTFNRSGGSGLQDSSTTEQGSSEKACGTCLDNGDYVGVNGTLFCNPNYVHTSDQTQANADCATFYNRGPYNPTTHTCGDCLDGYNGQNGTLTCMKSSSSANPSGSSNICGGTCDTTKNYCVVDPDTTNTICVPKTGNVSTGQDCTKTSDCAVQGDLCIKNSSNDPNHPAQCVDPHTEPLGDSSNSNGGDCLEYGTGQTNPPTQDVVCMNNGNCSSSPEKSDGTANPSYGHCVTTSTTNTGTGTSTTTNTTNSTTTNNSTTTSTNGTSSNNNGTSSTSSTGSQTGTNPATSPVPVANGGASDQGNPVDPASCANVDCTSAYQGNQTTCLQNSCCFWQP